MIVWQDLQFEPGHGFVFLLNEGVVEVGCGGCGGIGVVRWGGVLDGDAA